MNFAVETTLDRETVEAYHRITAKSVMRFKLTVIQVALLVVGTVAAVAGMASVFEVGMEPLSVACMVAGIIMLTLDMNYFRYLSWKTCLRMGTGMVQKFYFEDKRLVAQTSAEQVTHGYDAFQTVAESQDYYALFLNKHFGYILPKKGFFEGDPAALRAFLEEKSGKPVRSVKIKSGGTTHE